MRLLLCLAVALCVLQAHASVDAPPSPPTQEELDAIDQLIALQKQKIAMLQKQKQRESQKQQSNQRSDGDTVADGQEGSARCGAAGGDASCANPDTPATNQGPTAAAVPPSKPKDMYIEEEDEDELDVMITRRSLTPRQAHSVFHMQTVSVALPRRRKSRKTRNSPRRIDVILSTTSNGKLVAQDVRGRQLASVEVFPDPSASISALAVSSHHRVTLVTVASTAGTLKSFVLTAWMERAAAGAASSAGAATPTIPRVKLDEDEFKVSQFDPEARGTYDEDQARKPAKPSGQDAGASRVTDVAVYHKRRFAVFLAAYGDGVVRLYSRNGTLRSTFNSQNKTILFAGLAGSQFMYSTPSGFGMFRIGNRKAAYPRYCDTKNITTGIISMVANPMQMQYVYATTREGSLLVFNIKGRRRAFTSCQPKDVVTVERGVQLRLEAMSGYVLVTSATTLYIYNVTARNSAKPVFVMQRSIEHATKEPKDAKALLLGIHESPREPVYITVQTNEGSMSVFESFLPPEEKEKSRFGAFRFPLFLGGLVVALLYQYCKKRGARTRRGKFDFDMDFGGSAGGFGGLRGRGRGGLGQRSMRGGRGMGMGMGMGRVGARAGGLDRDLDAAGIGSPWDKSSLGRELGSRSGSSGGGVRYMSSAGARNAGQMGTGGLDMLD